MHFGRMCTVNRDDPGLRCEEVTCRGQVKGEGEEMPGDEGIN